MNATPVHIPDCAAGIMWSMIALQYTVFWRGKFSHAWDMATAGWIVGTILYGAFA